MWCKSISSLALSHGLKKNFKLGVCRTTIIDNKESNEKVNKPL